MAELGHGKKLTTTKRVEPKKERSNVTIYDVSEWLGNVFLPYLMERKAEELKKLPVILLWIAVSVYTLGFFGALDASATQPAMTPFEVKLNSY